MRSRTIPFVDDRQAWSIVCFVVRAGYRRRGLMQVLLTAAVQHARQYGADVVEGYPVDLGPGERVDVISGYVGTRRLFEAAGFEVAGPTTGRSGGQPRVVMRCDPGPP
jgi:GNAT superfamily N-acetyltransferase